MASNAIQSPDDVVDFLVSQHEQIKSLFEETLSASGKQREEAFVELRRLLAVHETVEEEIVHPRVKRKIADGKAVVEKRLEEEHEAKTVLKDLERLDVDSAEFTSQLQELRDAVLDHAEHEEKDEFTKLVEQLSSDELQKMGRAAKLAEVIAPTRPHAGVESQMANLVAGPFAAMMDRARDAILGKG
ncbi:hemerythrin domain-containing protein [Mycobacterium szulgai]|uniref:Hemerythrin n=1 Tax=Mycobacterium szulgai TaxID=1787 RepID=A0A1X2EHW2_MYCSZ|nr:hemerythrin domain-containing protein [Mycobacterium szulgai]MCV7077025.1 hemerythrin domain-containing protein [Mycobacterium szulgai]ORX02714.1 hemerythrin [Mycobacterium szulgai]